MAALIEKTLNSLQGLWRDIAQNPDRQLDKDLTKEKAQAHLLTVMQDCLNDLGGEVSARARAARLGEYYLGLDEPKKFIFLRLLAENFSSDQDNIQACLSQYQLNLSDGNLMISQPFDSTSISYVFHTCHLAVTGKTATATLFPETRVVPRANTLPPLLAGFFSFIVTFSASVSPRFISNTRMVLG